MAKDRLELTAESLQKKAGQLFLNYSGGYNRTPRSEKANFYAKYQEGIKKLQQENPIGFADLQEKNTDAKLKMLDTLAFDMDEYGKDAISRKGLDILGTTLNVPFGTYDTGLGSRAGRRTLGETIPKTQEGYSPRVYVAGGLTGDPERLKEVLRHEGQHNVGWADSENKTRLLDNMYADVSGRERQGIPTSKGNTKDLKMTKSDLSSFLRTARDLKYDPLEQNRKRVPDAPGVKGKEYLDPEEVNNLTSAQQMSILGNAREWESAINGSISRDLPNVGWFDESVNKMRSAFAF